MKLLHLLHRITPPRTERGATAVEYGLMVGLLSLAIIGAVTSFGGGVRHLFELIPPAVWGRP